MTIAGVLLILLFWTVVIELYETTFAVVLLLALIAWMWWLG